MSCWTLRCYGEGMTSKLSLGKKAVGHTGSYGLSEMATEWDSKH